MVSRRDLLGLAGTGAVASVGASALTRFASAQSAKSLQGYFAPKLEEIRVGLIGVGNRGYAAVQRLTHTPRVKLLAICDLDEGRVAKVAKELTERNYASELKVFQDGPTAYRRMNDLDLDVVYIATPWNQHAPMAIDAMKKGKHALVEVPICTTLEEGSALVETAEKQRRHCMMLENVCYGRTEMALPNMVKAGLLGTIVHAEASYIHYLTQEMFGARVMVPYRWRLHEAAKRNGNLYPTHGLGPVSKCLEIGENDHFQEIVSMGSLQAGLSEYAMEHYGPNSHEFRTHYALGDMNTSLIRTAKGRTIMVQHDTTNPRPYTRLNVIVGTKGTFMGFPDRLYLHKDDAEPRYDPKLTEDYLERYDHAFWRPLDNKTKIEDHDQADIFMDHAWVDNLLRGRPMDISVYESVAWSIVGPLSEQSIKLGSVPVKFPKLL